MVNQILTTFIQRFLEFLKIPFTDSEVAWTITPVIITLLILFIYFRRYKDEELGWNTAVANTLVTIFVSVELLKHIYFLNGGEVANYTTYISKTIATIILLFFGFILFIINIEHALPKKIAYHISSPLTINLLAYILISFVHSTIPYDYITLLALISLFIILRLFLAVIEMPVDMMFKYIDELKTEEKVKDIKKAEKFVKQGRRELKLKTRRKV